MLETWGYSLGSVVLVSLISFVGVVVIALSSERLHRLVFLLVSLAVGALLGDAFIHLLPESFEALPGPLTTPLLVLTGMLGFFVIENLLHWHHHHHDAGIHVHPVGYINIIADGLHNLIDGVLIGASYLVSIPLGLATTLAVILHEVPQEIGDFGVLVNAGFSKARALLVNFLSACAAILGVVIVLVLGEQVSELAIYALPITAGGFIYIAGTDLLPQLQSERKLNRLLLQLGAIVIGVVLMAALTTLE